MRFVRFEDSDNQIHQGWIVDDQVGLVDGSIFGAFQRQEVSIPLRKVRLLPPVMPSKIVCVGRNYAEHAREQGADLPSEPLIFFKPPSSLVAPGEAIVLPPQSQQVEYEGELAVVIGKRAKNITSEIARQHILGYTIANDVTARDLQHKDNQWTRAKGFDTFCPVGPWIETSVDPFDLLVSTHVNGILRQMSSTKDMIFPIYELAAYITSIMTLEPGDLILTGTPAGVGGLKHGDSVRITIEGIGELSNPVINSEPIQ